MKNGLIRIVRAGWVKTTSGTKNRRQYTLICPDKNQNKYYQRLFYKTIRNQVNDNISLKFGQKYFAEKKKPDAMISLKPLF